MAIVALPLAIAFAIGSGVSPQQGLYTAIVAGFLISALGGSRVQIGGPTGAFIVIVYGVVRQHGVDGLALATMMAGVLLLIVGLARFGSVIKFIPFPVISGFTSGIAVIIAIAQGRDFFGLHIDPLPAATLAKLGAYASAASSGSVFALLIGGLSVAVVATWPRVSQRLPGPLIALVVTTVLVAGLRLPVETIGSRFGGVPDTLPHLTFPSISWARLQDLFPSAFTICRRWDAAR